MRPSPTAEQEPPPPSRRHHFRRQPRPGRVVPVRYAIVDGAIGARGPLVEASTLNIGVGGAFICTDDPPPPGTALWVVLQLPAERARGAATIEIKADVRWIADGDDDEEHGMGVRFTGLGDEALALLNDWFASLTPTLDHDEPG